jgi:hypothetical protein
MPLNAARVGAAARANSLLAEKIVAVPYFWLSASIVLVSRFHFDLVSRLGKSLSVNAAEKPNPELCRQIDDSAFATALC